MPDVTQVIDVDDPDDPSVEPYRSLRDPVLRDDRGCFIAEGPDVVRDAMAAGLVVVSALVDRRLTPPPALPDGTVVLRAAPQVIGAITGLGVHRGILALVRRPSSLDAREIIGGARRVVILERVENPVNVGLIARSAAGLGADALLVDATTADPLYRRAVTASRGATMRLPWARIDDATALVRSLGSDAEPWTTVALSPDAKGIDLRDLAAARARQRDDRLALVLGSEGPGLRLETISGCSVVARIAMHRAVDSLNVAMAGAIALWALFPEPTRRQPLQSNG